MSNKYCGYCGRTLVEYLGLNGREGDGELFCPDCEFSEHDTPVMTTHTIPALTDEELDEALKELSDFFDDIEIDI